jgi:response regulator RpfG family c-di-GMP phosphodiesterase
MGPQSPNRSSLYAKKVLLIDRCQATREARAAVLRSRGVEVHEGEEFSGARFLWQPNVYDLILLDVRRHLPGEALEFYQQIKETSPRERFAFLVGPPVYLSLTWPEELMNSEKQPQEWADAVRRFMAAA